MSLGGTPPHSKKWQGIGKWQHENSDDRKPSGLILGNIIGLCIILETKSEFNDWKIVQTETT